MHPVTLHLKALVESRAYRQTHDSAVIQGEKNVLAVLNNGMRLKKLGVIAPKIRWDIDEIEQPAIGVIDDPDKLPAIDYYISPIHVARKILGTNNRPGLHQLWAEVSTYKVNKVDKGKVRRVLIMDNIHDNKQVAEIIRAGRALAFDMGMLCESENQDLYGLDMLRKSRLQTLFFPTERVPRVQLAVENAELMGCTPIYIRPLPEWEISRSQVGVPLFWRQNKRHVDVGELQGKVALVISKNERLPIEDDSICVSIPLAISPLGPSVFSSLSTHNAAAQAMVAINGLDNEYRLRQPKGLEPTDIEDIEGRMVTKAVAKKLGVPRPLSDRQVQVIAKSNARNEFEEAWAAEERRLGLVPKIYAKKRKRA
jgi:tRNA G18 (ribose-2'-O)-methylase SpoU